MLSIRLFSGLVAVDSFFVIPYLLSTSLLNAFSKYTNIANVNFALFTALINPVLLQEETLTEKTLFMLDSSVSSEVFFLEVQ